MTRFLAAVLVLLSQAFAILGAGNLVECVQPDGAAAVELAGSECCRTSHEHDAQPSDGDDARTRVSTRSDARCTDAPYRFDLTVAARGSQLRSLPRPDLGAALAAIVASPSVVSFAPAFDALRRVRGPPREAVPRHARPFVLRC